MKNFIALFCLISAAKTYAQPETKKYCPIVVEFTVEKGQKKVSAKVIESACTATDSLRMRFIQANLNPTMLTGNHAKPGKYIASVNYIVDKNGIVSDVACMTDLGFGFCNELRRVIVKSPNWTPAKKAVYDPEKELYETISALDSTFFAAYNNCDMQKQAVFYSDNIEFYHDKSGLDTSKKHILENTQKYICGKVTRELVKGSIEVSPLPGYGAVEMGAHMFHNNQEPNDTPHASKFVIIWKNTAGIWTITKVISLH